MSRHDPEIILRQMRDHAREVGQITTDRRRDDLDTDRMFQLAILHLLQIIGEAANRMPQSEQHARPAIPWNDIIGFRHRVAHGYDTVNFDVVWRVCQEEVPAPVAILDTILERDTGV